MCLYISYLESLTPFSDDEIGRMVKAMLTYAETGEDHRFDGNERFIWPSLKAQIDRDKAAYQERCEKNRANGAKGGRPPKNQSVIPETEWFSEKPKKAKEKEKEKEKETEKEKESIEADKPPTRHRYGAYENVLLSDEEYAKLKAEFPTDYAQRIERLSEYIASSGKKYKSHLATIRSWARKDGQKQTAGIVLAPLEDPFEAAVKGGRYA